MSGTASSNPTYLAVAGTSTGPTLSITGSNYASSLSLTSTGPHDLLNRMLRDGTFPPDFERQLASLESNAERIDYMYSFMKKHLDDLGADVIEKNDEESEKLQKQGDDQFRAENYINAYKLYCKAVAKADSDIARSFAYSKRAKVLEKWKMRSACIKDTHRALEFRLPPLLEASLQRQAARAKEREERREAYYSTIPVIPDSDKHPELVGVVDCVQLMNNMKFGNHLVATREIELGEVIAVLEPAIYSVFDNDYFHCHHCAKVTFSSVACELCTKAFYCSTDCRKWCQPYHKYECVINRRVEALVLKHRDQLSMKLAYVMRDHYANIENVKETDINSKSIAFKRIYNMSHHQNQCPPDTLVASVYRCTYVYHFLKHCTDFFNVPEQEKVERVFKELIVLNRALVDSNAVRISEMANMHDDYFDSEIFGIGIYHIMSYVNHACNPNVLAVFYGTTLVLRAVGTISAGEQLYSSYGVRFDTHTPYLRDIVLINDFKLECNCRSCCEDWPTFDKKLLLLPKYKKSWKFMQAKTRRKVHAIYNKCFNDFHRTEKDFVTTDVYIAKLLAFEFCIRMFGNIRRMKHVRRRKPLWATMRAYVQEQIRLRRL